MFVVIILALASELFALLGSVPFHSVSGMLAWIPGRLWPQYKSSFSIGMFLCVAAILIAWGYGPLTSQSGLERQVRLLKIQVHELELDQVQKDSKITLLEHEIAELERHRARLVNEVVSCTRKNSVTATTVAEVPVDGRPIER